MPAATIAAQRKSSVVGASGVAVAGVIDHTTQSTSGAVAPTFDAEQATALRGGAAGGGGGEGGAPGSV